ncbi:membrane bound O-acyl transferase family-domain-containing protein [Lasiosphaeris hirsuta]|uniref:Membrane bound O-acyl transferase family-domain-containing protein n=1 Tax=Lasiosphaeris hirsuta TaxID=260670 RepID=A0AA40ANJ7_9PEZI|nr:membrane bound O-acyl transferase family-domain-containing protein [Lasiosphaeris hirsuta]
MLLSCEGIVFFFFFTSAYVFFGLAIQLPARSKTRYALAALNAASGAAALKSAGNGGFAFSQLWALATVNVALHAFSLLAIEGTMVDMQTLPILQRPRTAWRHWSNIRRLEILGQPQTLDTDYLAFAGNKCLRVIGLWRLCQLEVRIATEIFRSLDIPISASLTPLPTPLPSSEHLLFWAFETTRWMIYTWWALSAAHDFFSILFISILRWDEPHEWPPLFGSISEAYSLRRFWGVFWHRLNRSLADAYLPLACLTLGLKGNKDTVHPALRALWVFLFSVVFHAAANCAQFGRPDITKEMKFFMANFAVCYAETVAGRVWRGLWGGKRVKSQPGLLRRMLGYVWVYLVFFMLYPTWQWHVAWEVVRRGLVAQGISL